MVDKNSGSPVIMAQVGPAYVSSLYNQYAAMLLGYIFEVVKNATVAEQYLVAVFKDLPNEVDELSRSGANAFCYLQNMARKKLISFFDTVGDCEDDYKKQITVAGTNNKYVGVMNAEQQRVFCGIYWHGKTISKLAVELDKTEDAVKKILKECFTTIRRSSK